MSLVGKIKPALCHRHQEFTVGWIAGLPGQGQTLRRTLVIALDVTHHTTLDDAHPTSPRDEAILDPAHGKVVLLEFFFRVGNNK